MRTTGKIRWGIAGLGNIAERFAADLTKHAGNAVLQAVASRSIDKARQFSSAWGATHGYGRYDDLAADPKVDIVYVATIHPFHKSLTRLFLQAGKHVLVEKPGCTNVEDWNELCALAEQKGLFLGEAMKTMYFPAYIELKEYIQKHKLRISSIKAAFGTAQSPDPGAHIWNKSLAGGATLDVGVYPLWLYVDLCSHAGIDPGRPEVHIENQHPELEIDETASYIFKGDIKAELSASIISDLPRHSVITAIDPEDQNVTFIIQEKWWNPCLIRIVCGQRETYIRHNKRGDGLVYEIESVSAAIQAGITESTITDRARSAQVLGIAQDVLESAGYSHLIHI